MRGTRRATLSTLGAGRLSVVDCRHDRRPRRRERGDARGCPHRVDERRPGAAGARAQPNVRWNGCRSRDEVLATLRAGLGGDGAAPPQLSDRSLTFYRRLGFEAIDSYAPHDEVVWAFLESGPAQLMLARADAPVDHRAQAVLFYLHAQDLAGLRDHLVAHDRGERDLRRHAGAQAGDARAGSRRIRPHDRPDQGTAVAR